MKLKHFIKLIAGILIGYSVLFTVATLFFNYFSDKVVQIYPDTIALQFLPIFLISIFIFLTIVIYLFNSWLGKKWVRFNWSQVLLYTGAAAGSGPTAEIFINMISRAIVHHPLWTYQLLPVHGGDTSLVMTVIWPLYGFHIYCFHKALRSRHDKTSDFDLAVFVGIDAITIEVLVNVFTILLFYTYIFYYLAGDLNHLSTALIFLPYVILGYSGVKILHYLEKRDKQILFGVLGFLWSWLLIFIL